MGRAPPGACVISNCGTFGEWKTMLLSLMARLDLPSSGEILCEGNRTFSMKLDGYRIPEEQSGCYLPEFPSASIAVRCGECHVSHGAEGNECENCQKKAAELVARVGLPESVLNRYPALLSCVLEAVSPES